MAEKKRSAHYVDNKRLYDAYVEWHAARDQAAAAGKPEPEPPAYISESILKITNGYASKANFAGYSFRDEMVGDAIENIIRYYRNFDPKKSIYPFSYLSQCAHNAFILRILRERKQSYVKHKLIQNCDMIDTLIAQDHDLDQDYRVSIIDTLQMNLKPELEQFFERKKGPRAARKKVEGGGIEDLLEELNSAFEAHDEVQEEAIEEV